MGSTATSTTTSSPPEDLSSSTTPNPVLSEQDLAAYCADPRLNQLFQLPTDPSKGRPKPFQVSYADIGHHRENASASEEAEQVLLFFGPLFSSRYWNGAKHDLAKKYKIRMITVERPGIGKTDPVPAERLFQVWREVIPALLDHLAIKHVSVASHSGGTIFALDFVAHHPQLLHPTKPYLAMAGPWVNSQRNGVLTMTLAAALPSSLIAQAGSATTFMNSTLAPLLGVSGVVSGSMTRFWPAAVKETPGREGDDVRFEEAVREGVLKHVFAGRVTGIGQEAQVLLRKGLDETGWSDWGDVDVLAPRLGSAVREATGNKLKVDVFFAEKDGMIGDAGGKGPAWFEKCWQNVDGIEFRSEVVLGTDHDRVWDLRWDVLEKVFKTMTGST